MFSMTLSQTPCGKFSCKLEIMSLPFQEVVATEVQVGEDPNDPIMKTWDRIYNHHRTVWGEPPVLFEGSELDQKTQAWGYKPIKKDVEFKPGLTRNVTLLEKLT